MLDDKDMSLNALSKALVKVAFIASVTIIIIFFGYSCNLSSETIKECETACSSRDSKMQSVTERKCTCQVGSGNGDIWALPRANP